MRKPVCIVVAVCTLLVGSATGAVANQGWDDPTSVPQSIRIEAMTGGLEAPGSCAILSPSGVDACTDVSLAVWSLPREFRSASGEADRCSAVYAQTAFPIDAQPATCSFQDGQYNGDGAGSASRGQLSKFSTIARCGSWPWTWNGDSTGLYYFEYYKSYRIPITTFSLQATSTDEGRSGVWSLSLSATGYFADHFGQLYRAEFALSGSATGASCFDGGVTRRLALSLAGTVRIDAVLASSGRSAISTN